MSELGLDVGQANELKLALRAARGSDGSEWAGADVKSLSNSPFLGRVLDLIHGRAEIVVKKVEETVTTVKNILSTVKSITIEATVGKKTSDCFIDTKLYGYRDPNLDKLLPEFQEVSGSGVVTVNQITQKSKFVGMVQSLLGVIETSLKLLSRLAIDRDKIFTLVQIDLLIELQEAGEDVGLLTNGYANFFLVVNKKGGVSVVIADRFGGQWDVYVRSLDCVSVWDAGGRFFSRN